MILIAGIGNVFLGDDGFGCEVARRLQTRGLPDSVRVVDFGIRGIDLAYALEDCDAAILIDAMSRGNAPGTLYLIEPELAPLDEPAGFTGPADHASGRPLSALPVSLLDPHASTPDRVLRWLGRGRSPGVVRLVGCEPETFGIEGAGQDGLSAPVRAAVEPAIRIVEDLVEEIADA